MIRPAGQFSGMIGAFQKIGMGGMGKPELLAANIGEASSPPPLPHHRHPAMFAYFLCNSLAHRADAEGEYSASTPSPAPRPSPPPCRNET